MDKAILDVKPKIDDSPSKLTFLGQKPDESRIRVLTLNCWGLKFVSKDRQQRFRAIADLLNQSDYNVVFLQEVWINADFEELAQKVSDKLPFCHFFDSGIIGSGICILSTSRLQEANFHEFSINGYPTNFWHGDWFAAKGIGVCQIFFQGFDVHLYTSHYHANYNPKNDIYLSHRVSHAFESAQWIKLASSAADLTIYAGDFNTDPESLPYKLLRAIAPLQDCWEEATHQNGGGGETSETGRNSYTHPNETNRNNGHRIDYVMYSAGPNIKAQAVECILPLPSRVPGQSFSFSDHEGVEATIKLQRIANRSVQSNTAVAYRRIESTKLRDICVETVNEAITIIDRAVLATVRYQTRYLVLALVLILLLVASFVPMLVLDGPNWMFGVLDVSLFLPRFVITVALVICFLMATLFTQKERNALKTSKKHLKLLLDQDCDLPK